MRSYQGGDHTAWGQRYAKEFPQPADNSMASYHSYLKQLEQKGQLQGWDTRDWQTIPKIETKHDKAHSFKPNCTVLGASTGLQGFSAEKKTRGAFQGTDYISKLQGKINEERKANEKLAHQVEELRSRMGDSQN